MSSQKTILSSLFAALLGLALPLASHGANETAVAHSAVTPHETGKEALTPVGDYPPPYKVGIGETVVIEKMDVCGGGFQNSKNSLEIPVSPGDRKAVRLIANGKELANLQYAWWVAPVQICCYDNKITDVSFSREKGTFRYSGSLPLRELDKNAQGSLKYEEQIRLTDDGRVRFDIKADLPEIAGKRPGVFWVIIPYALVSGQNYVVDGSWKTFPLNISEMSDVGVRKSLTLFQGSSKEISLESVAAQYVVIKAFNNNLVIQMMPRLSDSALSFILDTRKVPEASRTDKTTSYAGVDCWQSDRLVTPSYTARRNLLPNPSFESGLRYFTYPCTTPGGGFVDTGAEKDFSIDSTVSLFGNHSLRIKLREGAKNVSSIQSFAMPVKPGVRYTLSFYGKSDAENLPFSIGLGGWNGKNPKPGNKAFSISTGDWKRHSFTFTSHPEHSVLSISLGAGRIEQGHSNIWIDGMQLEEGDNASDFTCAPVFTYLETSSPDNFFDANVTMDARLRIETEKPRQKGKVSVTLEDFFYNARDVGTYEFETDERLEAVVPLDIDKIVHCGIYVIRTLTCMENTEPVTDYFRVAKIKKLANKHKNKDIIGYDFSFGKSPRVEDILSRWRDVGIGSTVYASYIKHDQESFKLLDKYGIAFYCDGMFKHPDPTGTANTISITPFGTTWGVALNKDEKILLQGIKTWQEMTPEREKMVEDAAYEYAKYYHWIHSFAFGGEFLPAKIDLVNKENLDDFAKLIVAVAKGVKRANPENQTYPECGACTMMPGRGIAELDGYLAAVERVAPGFKFDRVATHPYRETPESPDLDDDAVCFLQMLSRHGYDNVPVDWLEGIYYAPYNIPAWKLNPYKGCSIDSYYGWNLSYHMGWGERISAAYSIRSWLVALKYQDRVKQSTNWRPWIYLDTYLAPMAIQAAINTLSNLLGNASFAKDIRFAPQSRAYVFEDEEKRPVAAMWSYIPEVDRGEKVPPTVEIAIDADWEIFTMTGDAYKGEGVKNGKRQIALSPFPIYVRGTQSAMQKMFDSMNGAVMVSGNKDASPLRISFTPGLQENKVEILNTLTIPQEGKLSLALAGKPLAANVNLHPRGQNSIPVPLKDFSLTYDIKELKIPYDLSVEKPSAAKYCGNLDVATFKIPRAKGGAVAAGGAYSGWDNIEWIKIKNRTFVNPDVKEADVDEKDFSAQFKMAWDENNLYLLVNVIDDKFVHDKKEIIDRGYDNDSLQIYFDTCCNARISPGKGYDGDDYNYDFFPEPGLGKAVAFRRSMPDQQLAGGLSAGKPMSVEEKVKTSFALTNNGYRYEITFPKVTIMPLLLASGSKFGFGLFLNDKDDSGGKIRSCLTISPAGTGCHGNPHLWPIAVLE